MTRVDGIIVKAEFVPESLEMSLRVTENQIPTPLNFAAILFDMDGVLIDSEPFWREAQLEVYASLGKTFTEQDCVEFLTQVLDFVGEAFLGLL